MSWLEMLETWTIVTLVTVLIWLWAEGENVQQYLNQQVQVQFVAPVGQEQSLAILPREPVEVELTFTTSTEQYDQFEHAVQQGAVQIPVTPGQQTLVLRELLSEHLLDRLGIVPQRVEPATASVGVQPLRVVTMRPVVVAPAGVELEAKVEPAAVQVRVPEDLAQLAASQDLAVPLALDDLRGQPGEPQSLTRPIRLPKNLSASPFAEALTNEVTVSYVVRRQTDTVEIESVPVTLKAPFALLRQFRIEVPAEQQFIRNVRLSGPSDVIRKIREGEIIVTGEIRPTIDELDSGIRSLPVNIDVPPSVQVLSPLPVVNFEVTRQQPADLRPAPVS